MSRLRSSDAQFSDVHMGQARGHLACDERAAHGRVSIVSKDRGRRARLIVKPWVYAVDSTRLTPEMPARYEAQLDHEIARFDRENGVRKT